MRRTWVGWMVPVTATSPVGGAAIRWPGPFSATESGTHPRTTATAGAPLRTSGVSTQAPGAPPWERLRTTTSSATE